MEAIVSVKGQIVIPIELRKKFGIEKGGRVLVYATEDGIMIKPVTTAFIRGLRGSLKGAGLLDELRQDRMDERRRDE